MIVPTFEFPPVTPSTDHASWGLLCPCTLALNCSVAPVLIVSVLGAIETNPVTVTVALALFVVSTTLVAVTTCVPDCVGAVYKPEVLMVPTLLLPPATESTDQVTAVLLVPVTAAVNCCCAPAGSVREL